MYAHYREKGKCFGVALANYFWTEGKGALADEVYQAFHRHPFVGVDGSDLSVNAMLSTRLVTDLTHGRYVGEFITHGYSKWREGVQDTLGTQAQEALNAVLAEQNEGRIIQKKKISFDTQRKSLLRKNYHDIPGQETGHWILYCGAGNIVNDGEFKTIYDWDLFLSFIDGVLTLEKVGN